MRHAENDNLGRIYGSLTRAIVQAEIVGPLASAAGNPEQIEAGVVVYRNNVRSAFLRCLQDAFPVVERLVGQEFFRYAAAQYFQHYRPTSKLVLSYAEGFPEFLKNLPMAAKQPYLCDVARIELARLRAYHAEDAVALLPAALFALLEGDVADHKINIHPSVKIVDSKFQALKVWRREQSGSRTPLLIECNFEQTLIYRPDADVCEVELTPAMAALITSFQAGHTFSRAFGNALEVDPAIEVSSLIADFARLRVVTSVCPPTITN